MTKQEQIEGIAKTMCLFCKEMTEEKDCERGKECFDWRLKEARFYYEQGCRIINKDSVVLSMEEWECLHNDYAKALYNARQQPRKETAKELLNKFRGLLVDIGFTYMFSEDTSMIGVSLEECVGELNEMFKKYGVEVEE